MTEQELRKIIGENIPFEELEKTGEVFEIFKQGNMSLNIQWKVWDTSDGKEEAFLFHICKDGEQIPVGGKYWYHPHGYLFDRSAPMTDVVCADIADAWNRCCACSCGRCDGALLCNMGFLFINGGKASADNKGAALPHIPDDTLPY